MNSRRRSNADHAFGRTWLLWAVLATAALFLIMMRAFLVPVILAAVIVGLFHPAYAWLLRRTGGRRSLSSFLSCAGLLLGALLPAALMVNLASREATRLSQQAGPQIRALLEGTLEQRLQPQAVIRQLGLDQVRFSQTFERLAADGSGLLAKGITVVSRSTFELILTLGATFITMFYFFRDGPQLLARLRYLSPLPDPAQDELLGRLLSVSRATLRGTLLTALIQGLCGGLTFWIFGIQAPVLWGGVMALISILPLLGPWVVMYPAALVLCLGGQVGQGIAVFLIATLFIGLLDNLLQPILVGRDAGMPELMVFFSMVGGLGLFGPTGFVVGPVIGTLFLVMLELYGKAFRRQLVFGHNDITSEAASEPT